MTQTPPDTSKRIPAIPYRYEVYYWFPHMDEWETVSDIEWTRGAIEYDGFFNDIREAREYVAKEGYKTAYHMILDLVSGMTEVIEPRE